MLYFIAFVVGGLFGYFIICLIFLMIIAKIADKLLEADKDMEEKR